MPYDPLTLPDLNEKDDPLPGEDYALKTVDRNKYRVANYMYPANLGQPGAGLDHYMIFYINESSNTQYATKGIKEGNLYTHDPNGNIITADTPTITANKKSDADPQPQQTNTTNFSSYSAIRRVPLAIALPMPEDLSVNYEIDWEDTEMGATGNMLDFAKDEASIKDVFASLGVSMGVNVTNVAAAASQLALKEAVSKYTRMAVNPHMEVIFKGVRFRTFSFKFKFTPSTEREAENIYNIISAFKFYSSPEIKEGSGGRFWIYPAEFDIKFISAGVENMFIHRISTCCLKRLDVNPTAAGFWVAHRKHEWGGCPPAVTEMSLQFQELEIMQKKRARDGF